MTLSTSQLVTAPAEEPVSLSEVKQHLRILHNNEDPKIAAFAKAARQHIEKRISRALITQTRRLWLPAWPSSGRIEIDRPPLIEVTSVKYRDADDAEQTLSAATYHVVKDAITPYILRKPAATWPVLGEHPQAVEVTFTAGYGATPAAVDEDLRNAILMMAEHLYFNRGETSETNLARNPVAVDALIGPYMTHGWI